MTREHQEEFDRDCLKWRGRLLTGKYAHWCYDWDGLPIDETTQEWPCRCTETDIVERLREDARGGMAYHELSDEAADEIMQLRAERDALQAEVKRLTRELPSAD
jgi:hypothetical protein